MIATGTQLREQREKDFLEVEHGVIWMGLNVKGSGVSSVAKALAWGNSLLRVVGGKSKSQSYGRNRSQCEEFELMDVPVASGWECCSSVRQNCCFSPLVYTTQLYHIYMKPKEFNYRCLRIRESKKKMMRMVDNQLHMIVGIEQVSLPFYFMYFFF